MGSFGEKSKILVPASTNSAAMGLILVTAHSPIGAGGDRPYNFNRIQVLGGPAVIVTGKMGSQLDCEMPARLSDGGVFRLDVQPLFGSQVCALKVYRGAAAVQLPSFLVSLTAGKTMHLDHRCGDMIPWLEFDLRKTDELDQWSRERAGGR